MKPDIDHLAQLISSMSESLHSEMKVGFARVVDRLDLIQTQLDRQIIQLESFRAKS
jgi:hypothetical protein